MLTREEALDTMGATLDDWVDKKNMQMLIDKIYDSFEEAMKPKTCDMCRHLHGAICKHDRGLYCVRQFEADYYEPKDIQ